MNYAYVFLTGLGFRSVDPTFATNWQKHRHGDEYKRRIYENQICRTVVALDRAWRRIPHTRRVVLVGQVTKVWDEKDGVKTLLNKTIKVPALRFERIPGQVEIQWVSRKSGTRKPQPQRKGKK